MTRATSLIGGQVARFFVLLCCLVSQVTADEIMEEAITDFDRDHWAFKPLTRPPVPIVPDDSLVRNQIDRFVVDRLRQEDLRPLPTAARTTLLRRLKFDLLGLPPTPEEISTFSSAKSTQSYEQLVDRFLASPHYGERWAQHWLDLARFAETDGFEHDKVRAEAWRYRDWVIQALNSDMPYDRFLKLQLAGDELEPDSPDALIATAFCLSGPDMPDINSQEERRHNLLNEMTATVGSVVMALQLGCAQCHDHKYDPVSQADFYRMRALFDPAVQVKKDRSVFTLTNATAAKPSFVMLRGDHRHPGIRIAPGFVRVADIWNTELQPSATKNASGRRTALANWLTKPAHPLTARVMVNRVWHQHFGRGLAPTTSDFGVMGEMPSHPELLDWLATEFVANHWSLKYLHRLIVTSATYQRASRGTEPDWTEATKQIAARRLRTAADVDPTNELLARFPRRRLDGEIVRDAMLSVSNSLNRQAGGPGVRPPLPPEMLKTLLTNQWNSTDDPAQHMRRSIYVFARRNLRYPIFDAFDRPDANVSCACRNESTTATQSLLMLNSEQALAAARRLADICMAEADRNPNEAARVAFLRCFARPMDSAEQQMIDRFLPPNRGRRSADEYSPIDLGVKPRAPAFRAPSEGKFSSTGRLTSIVDLCLAYLNASEFVYID